MFWLLCGEAWRLGHQQEALVPGRARRPVSWWLVPSPREQKERSWRGYWRSSGTEVARGSVGLGEEACFKEVLNCDFSNVNVLKNHLRSLFKMQIPRVHP